MFSKYLISILMVAFTFSAVADVDFSQKHVPGELIIKFKNEKSLSPVVILSADEKNSFRSSQARVYKFPSVVDLSAVVKELQNDPNIDYVELNSIYELQGLPDDARFDELFGMHNEGQTGGTIDADIDAVEAWDDTVGSRDVLVGVIDTGIDYTHPDIAANYWSNPGETGLDANGLDKSSNGIDDDENGYIDDHKGWDFINDDNDPMDGNNHGTHCAGTIGAVGNNGVGVAGVNWEVSLVGLKIFSDAGSTTTAAIIEAIEYSTLIGVDVTNNSWGGGPASEAMQAAIQEANDKDILFVAAAGNNRSDNDLRDFFPANYDIPNIISVAAIDHNDAIASFSNYGATKVDVGAPGVNILSTFPGNRYGKISGTSMAAPHVTGLAALVKSKFRDLSADKIKARILNTGDSTLSLSNKTGTGKRINARNALEIDNIAPNPPTNLLITENRISSVIINFSPSGDDGDEGLAEKYEVRISDQPISEETWEDSRVVIPQETVTASSSISMSISGLDINSTGYIALKAIDNLGNTSSLSESVFYATKEVSIAYQDQLDDLNGFSEVEEWGIEEINGETFLTESPDGNYKNNINTSITSDKIIISNENNLLNIDLMHNLETRFDNAYIEIQNDINEEWIEIAKFSGKSELKSLSYDLTDYLLNSASFKIRFRVKTDSSRNLDGLQINKFVIITAIN